MLAFILGATVTASTAVLVAFMGGLAIGAVYFGKKATKAKNSQKLLSIILFGIGISGLINYILFSGSLFNLYHVLYGLNFLMFFNEAIIFIVCTLLLVIQTFFMGGLLPIVSKILIRSENSISSGLGKIYALETLGSTLGGILAGFLFLGQLGQQNTIFLAIAINFIASVYLLLSSKSASTEQENFETAGDIKSIPKGSKSKNSKRRIAYRATFVFGFAMIALQLIWIRIFKIYLTNTSYTFALISSLIILGLFAGSWLFSGTSKKIKNHLKTLVYSLLLLGILTGMGLILLVKMPEFFMFPFESLLSDPVIKLILMPLAAALFIVLPPAIISGFSFPLVCTMLSENKKEISLNVGMVLSYNSLGSVLGPLFATFFMIPFLGVGVSILLIILVVLANALYIIFTLKKENLPQALKPILIAITGGLLITILFPPAIQILPPSFSKVEKEVKFYKETVEATLAVSIEKNARSEIKTTYVNNAVVIGSTYDAIKAVKMIGHLPFFAGLKCEDALVVGFGIGVTTSTIASHSEVKSIDCIELAGGLKEAANFYNDINKNVINDKRLNFIQGDGRHFLLKTTKKYDLISSDPTHPILGSANLYSKEYFELCKKHLNPGGMVSQYLPLHKLRPVDFQGIIKTFYSVFPGATVWLGHTHAILLGSNEAIKIDFSDWSDNIERIGRDPVFYSNPYHLAATLMFSEIQMARIPENIPVNTDNRSYLEFFSYACFDQDNLNKNISFLANTRGKIDEVFTHIQDERLMERFVLGSQYFIESAKYFQEGNKQKSLDELRKAVRANPENQEYPFLIKFYFNVER